MEFLIFIVILLLSILIGLFINLSFDIHEIKQNTNSIMILNRKKTNKKQKRDDADWWKNEDDD